MNGAQQRFGVCHENGAQGSTKPHGATMIERTEREEKVCWQGQFAAAIHRSRYGKHWK